MTDVPPDNDAAGLPPAAPSDPPVVRRSNYSEPPPGTEPPTFDDDALAEAMAAEVATYTSPITLPKVPPIAPPAAAVVVPEIPPAPAAPAQAPPAPPALPVVAEPATTWDGRPPAEEAEALGAPVDAAPATAAEDDGEPSEDELRRALGGASTLETIERLEKELQHISNGEPTILPVTATPAAGVTLGVPAPFPAPAPALAEPSAPPEIVPPAPVFAPLATVEQAPEPEPARIPPEPEPARIPPEPEPAPIPPEPEPEPEPAPDAPEPVPAEAASSWPFSASGEPDPEPALDHPAPGHFFPAAFEPIHPDATPQPSPIDAASAEPPVAEPSLTEPPPSEVATAESASTGAPDGPQLSEPLLTEPALPDDTAAPEPTTPPSGNSWAFPTPEPASSADASEVAPAPAPDSDPLAWLTPPADSTFPPPPGAPAFEPAVPEPFAPEPPDPRSYAPYPFEVDPSLIDPVAAATVAAPTAEPAAAAPATVDPVEFEYPAPVALSDQRAPDSPADTVPADPEPEPAAVETPWWSASEPTDGVWEIATPDPDVLAPLEGAAPPEASALEVEAAPPEVEASAPQAQAAPPDVPAASPEPEAAAPVLGVPTPYSTEPPVGPESPDWLSAPPPDFTPPDLIEPPGFVDSPPNAALDPVAPITANTMASLPMPLPTDQPNIADRAELPPPPGYEDIPIMSRDVTEPAQPVAPSAFFPAAAPVLPAPVVPVVPTPAAPAAVIAAPIASPPVVVPPAPAFPPADPISPIGALPTVTERSGFDHEDDDVIDEVDRVTGTGAIPISSAGTIEPLAPPSEPIATIRLGEDQPALVEEQPQEPPAFEVEAAGPEPTPLDMRAGRAARLFWLWFAANSSVLSMGLGAVLLATGMSLRQSIVATLAGVAISFLPLGLGTLAGKWSGQPTMIVSRAAFGHAGNILPALLAVLTRVLWGGVLLWLLATAVAQVLVGAGLDAGLGTAVWQLVGLVAGFVIATVIAVFGYGFVAKLQLVVSVVSGLLILGSAALTFQHLDVAKALTVPDGNWILVVAGAALVFSVVGLAWVHSSSDLARYQRTGSSGAASMLWATFGATLPPFLLVVWGAMLAASDPALGKKLATNPLAAIASLLPAWYPAPLLAFAALGLLSGAVVTMYSGGFALQALGLKLRRNLGTLISAILVLAVSAALIFVVTDFSSLVRGLIITIAVPVAAWAGIFAAEMMIRTRRFHTPSLLAPGGIYPQLRPLNFLALIIISVIGLGLVTSNVPGLGWEGFLYGIASIGPKNVLASSDAGVFVALLLGILVPLVGGIPSIRRQERTAVVG